MLAVLYVQTADLEGDGAADACALYGKALAIFEPIAAGVGLPPDARRSFERAKARAAGCRG